MNEAMGLAISMSMTVGVAVHITAPAVTAMMVDMDVVAVGVAMNTSMVVPLRMNMNRGLVAIGQCRTGDHAGGESDRQRAVMIGPRRRCSQNSNEKRYEEECTHLVSSFCQTWKRYAA